MSNASLETINASTSTTASILLVGGGTTLQRPANPPLNFIYFNTDTSLTETWNGTAWVSSAVGGAGPTGPIGPNGPQGPAGPTGPSGSGTTYWSSITGKPALFDIADYSLGNPGFIRYNNGLQMTWFYGSSATSEGIYATGYPFPTGTPLAIFVAPNLNQGLWTSDRPGDSWFQILSFDGATVTYGLQNGNQGAGLVPATPSFLVISQN